MTKILELMSRLRFHPEENVENFTYQYYDKEKDKLIERHIVDIENIEGETIIIQVKDILVKIHISQITKVKKNGKIIWEESSK